MGSEPLAASSRLLQRQNPGQGQGWRQQYRSCQRDTISDRTRKCPDHHWKPGICRAEEGNVDLRQPDSLSVVAEFGDVYVFRV